MNYYRFDQGKNPDFDIQLYPEYRWIMHDLITWTRIRKKNPHKLNRSESDIMVLYK